MTNPLGRSATITSKLPIGVQGVIDYCDEMNARHPFAPYVWRVGERMHESEGRMVKCVEAVRKSELRSSPPRVGGRDAKRLIAETARAFEDA